MASIINLTSGTEPATPSAGSAVLYVDGTGFAVKDDAGDVIRLVDAIPQGGPLTADLAMAENAPGTKILIGPDGSLGYIVFSGDFIEMVNKSADDTSHISMAVSRDSGAFYLRKYANSILRSEVIGDDAAISLTRRDAAGDLTTQLVLRDNGVAITDVNLTTGAAGQVLGSDGSAGTVWTTPSLAGFPLTFPGVNSPRGNNQLSDIWVADGSVVLVAITEEIDPTLNMGIISVGTSPGYESHVVPPTVGLHAFTPLAGESVFVYLSGSYDAGATGAGTVLHVPRAAFVANGSTVDQLRDALIAVGLMAAS